jgi:TolB-like protein
MPLSTARTHLVARLALLLTILASGCSYGFSGGGMPTHVRTVAVLPFSNETASPEITREFTDALREGLSKRLGLRDASEEKASAIARGTIVKYEIDVPVAYSANTQQVTATRRRLQVVVDVEIFDQVTGKTLWQKKGIVGEGEYSERFEVEGRKQAIGRIVNEVIEGAQSQW